MTAQRRLVPLSLVITTVAVATLALAFAWPVLVAHIRPPEQTLQLFYSTGDHEPELADPLILAGRRVAPLVVSRIGDPAMPRRRYALTFLGCTAYQPAAQALERMVQSETEQDYFRGDAIEALNVVDSRIAHGLANRYSARQDYLGRSSRLILSNDPSVSYRCSAWRILRERWLPPEKYE